MKLNISKGSNVNYLAKIVYVDKFTPHPNHEYTKLKVAHIDGFNLIVSTDMTEGIVIKKEDGIAHAWKLKTFAFMNREQKELDKGIENVEDNS